MNVGAIIITSFFMAVLTVISILCLKMHNNDNDIAKQIIREHEEEIKRLRQRYE